MKILISVSISVSVYFWNNTGADLNPLVGDSSSMMENLCGMEGHDVEDLGKRW